MDKKDRVLKDFSLALLETIAKELVEKSSKKALLLELAEQGKTRKEL